MHVNRITKAFKEAREPAESRVTTHQRFTKSARSQSAPTWLQGNVDTKVLLGHTSEKTAAIYADPRGVEPIRVKVS